MAIKIQDITKAGLASFMKSSLVARIRWNIGSDLIQPRSSRKSKISRVTTRAVNKLAATPMVRATPKPLIEPVPMYIRMTDEISVVMCESKMTVKADRKSVV